MLKTCLVLTSSSPSTLVVEQNQRRMLDALLSRKVRLSYRFIHLDCDDKHFCPYAWYIAHIDRTL